MKIQTQNKKIKKSVIGSLKEDEKNNVHVFCSVITRSVSPGEL